MNRYIHFFWFGLLGFLPLTGQTDSLAVQKSIYNRPFINLGKSPVAIGGYLEGNTNYFAEDGVSEGFNMEMRRFNIFLYSTISSRIKFLSELEFEHGTEEIALETAQVDFEFDPALVFRAGVLMVPIGAFNQNHDGPKWDFIERPLVATEIIPSTLSEVGFGLNGQFFRRALSFTYDAYLVNGLTDHIILNDHGRTFLQSGKSEDRLAEDNNGSPSLTGRVAIRHRKWGELGISHYRGAYNSFRMEGEEVDERRDVQITALDFNTGFRKATLQGEVAFNRIEVPAEISEIFGERQWGGYVEIRYPVLQKPVLGSQTAVVNLGLRAERVDYNVGTFSTTGTKIYDELNALAVSLALRPTGDTVIRVNYRQHWYRDALGNPTVKNAGVQFGVATYF